MVLYLPAQIQVQVIRVILGYRRDDEYKTTGLLSAMTLSGIVLNFNTLFARNCYYKALLEKKIVVKLLHSIANLFAVIKYLSTNDDDWKRIQFCLEVW